MQIRLRILIFGILALALRETDAKAQGLLGDAAKQFGSHPSNIEATITPRIDPPR
jgi:hypothetical protein